MKELSENEWNFFEKDTGLISFVPRTDQDRSLIATYFNVEKWGVATGNDSELKKFQNITVFDSDDHLHKFETDLTALYQIHEEMEDPEQFEVYKKG